MLKRALAYLGDVATAIAGIMAVIALTIASMAGAPH